MICLADQLFAARSLVQWRNPWTHGRPGGALKTYGSATARIWLCNPRLIPRAIWCHRFHDTPLHQGRDPRTLGPQIVLLDDPQGFQASIAAVLERPIGAEIRFTGIPRRVVGTYDGNPPF
jgi:hypothetical protein